MIYMNTVRMRVFRHAGTPQSLVCTWSLVLNLCEAMTLSVLQVIIERQWYAMFSIANNEAEDR